MGVTLRYFTDSGMYPEPTKAAFNISGPQSEDQIPEGVKMLLDMPGITQVDVRFDHGQGERIQVFRKMGDQNKTT